VLEDIEQSTERVLTEVGVAEAIDERIDRRPERTERRSRRPADVDEEAILRGREDGTLGGGGVAVAAGGGGGVVAFQSR
jgi:hypothetical protein